MATAKVTRLSAKKTKKPLKVKKAKKKTLRRAA